MNKLFARMLPALARGLRGARIDPHVALSTKFTVLPHDIDLNRHLNNGRYLQLIDLNRMEWLLRTRIAGIVVRQGWKPVLGSTAIHFRRELRLWETAAVSTRLLGWDERWVYLDHRVETAAGKPVATALARAGFRHAGGWVPIGQLVAALPTAPRAMVLPAKVSAWQALDSHLATQLTGNITPGCQRVC